MMASTTTAEEGKQLCLLMPTVRIPKSTNLHSIFPPSPVNVPTRSPRTKQPSAKFMRSRSGSAIEKGAMVVDVEGDGERWIGLKSRFEVVVERMELTGYQVYAVEKWIVERNRPMTLLTVYTGDPSHKARGILYRSSSPALSPMAELTYAEAVEEFTAAVQHLRKQVGGRPKQASYSSLGLSHLDYTIVHIPDGEFLALQDRLYSNINLLRMGCSGRGAVTLDEPRSVHGPCPTSRMHSRAHSHPATSPSLSPGPSVTSLHHSNASQASAPVTTSSSRSPHFALYVLELLAICGLFPLPSSHGLDGLLCDVTVEGLRRWGAEIGEKFPGFEATERIADPNMISLLLSFVLSARNKLSTLVQGVPKDPFLHPYEFLIALASYTRSQSFGGHPSVTQPTACPTVSGPSGSSIHAGPSVNPNIYSLTPVYLTFHLHNTIRHADSRRVHRVLLSKLDVGPTSEEDVTDEEKKGLGGRVMGLVSRTNVGAGGVISPIADLGSLMRTREKDRGSRDAEGWKERVDAVDEKEKLAGSLRALWGGRVEVLVRMRERAEGRERDANWKDKDRRTQSDMEDPAVKSNGEDDLVFGGAWSGKVQKKLEMWAGINRPKRSVDLPGLGKFPGRASSVLIPLSAQSSSSGHIYPASEVKGLGISTLALPQSDGIVDEDELLPSSGQVSPISISRSHHPFTLMESADVSSANLVGVDVPKHSSGKLVREPGGTGSAQMTSAKGESWLGPGNGKLSNRERQELDRRIGKRYGRILEEEVGTIEQDGGRRCRLVVVVRFACLC
ncbi:hypothetical protein EDC04DRAFT_2622019 [Pisolithus marmoratus]|nr:hypothetical protein EDC04DRAFT_2622019 [Pisolithus marmoratus]